MRLYVAYSIHSICFEREVNFKNPALYCKKGTKDPSYSRTFIVIDGGKAAWQK